MKPGDMGVLFDELADAGTATRVVLDRPFDLAPDRGTEWTVPALAGLVRETAGALAEAGAGPGGTVAIVKANHWDYDLVACAAVRLGAVPVKLSSHLAPDILRTLLDRCRPEVLVTEPAVLGAAGAAGVGLAECARATVVLDGAGDVPAGVLRLGDLRGHRVPGPRRRDDDAPLVVTHTSGTTGVPKLVRHTTRTLIHALARPEATRVPHIAVRRGDTVLNASAYPHGRTFSWTAATLCLAPRTVTIVSGQDPDTVDPLLRAHPPTVAEALPARFVRFRPLTERLDNPFRDMRVYISTYDAVHPPVIRSYLAASSRPGAVWVQVWGQTETGPLTYALHTRRSAGRRATPASTGVRNAGRPLPVRTRLRVVDPAGFRPVPAGTPGLVLARVPSLADGYVGECARWTAKRHGSWWVTGDIGVLGRDGSLRLLDREVDHSPLLSCLHAEDVLEERLPEALECVVLARPGADPLPVVVTADGRLDPDRWKRATEGLPPLAGPVVRTWDAIPRTGTGKVRRAALLEHLTGRAATCGTGRWT